MYRKSSISSESCIGFVKSHLEAGPPCGEAFYIVYQGVIAHEFGMITR